MTMRLCSLRAALLGGSILATACPLWAADVTPDRLVNADKEPQNWLMNHRTYDGQRFSPLARINRENVKNLKLAYAVALGGKAADENLEATPLAEDGFLYNVIHLRFAHEAADGDKRMTQKIDRDIFFFETFECPAHV